MYVNGSRNAIPKNAIRDIDALEVLMDHASAVGCLLLLLVPVIMQICSG